MIPHNLRGDSLCATCRRPFWSDTTDYKICIECLGTEGQNEELLRTAGTQAKLTSKDVVTAMTNSSPKPNSAGNPDEVGYAHYSAMRAESTAWRAVKDKYLSSASRYTAEEVKRQIAILAERRGEPSPGRWCCMCCSTLDLSMFTADEDICLACLKGDKEEPERQFKTPNKTAVKNVIHEMKERCSELDSENNRLNKENQEKDKLIASLERTLQMLDLMMKQPDSRLAIPLRIVSESEAFKAIVRATEESVVKYPTGTLACEANRHAYIYREIWEQMESLCPEQPTTKEPDEQK